MNKENTSASGQLQPILFVDDSDPDDGHHLSSKRHAKHSTNPDDREYPRLPKVVAPPEKSGKSNG